MWESPIPVLLFDSSSRRISRVNRAAAALFKTVPEELQGQLIESCVVQGERARLRAGLRACDPRWGEGGPWKCVARDGSRFVVQIRFHQTIQNGELVHVVLATHVVPAYAAKSAVTVAGSESSKYV